MARPLQELLNRARIFVAQGASLFGIMDEAHHPTAPPHPHHHTAPSHRAIPRAKLLCGPAAPLSRRVLSHNYEYNHFL